ncbi:DNA ligase [Dirofilaria immitis]
MFCGLFVVEINGASIQDSISHDESKLMGLVHDIKVYLKKLNDTSKQFPEEFIRGKDKIDEIEQNARKIVETIDNVRNAWYEEDYKKNMAIICETNQP